MLHNYSLCNIVYQLYFNVKTEKGGSPWQSFSAGGVGLIPGLRTKILHSLQAAQHGQKYK